MATTTAQGPGLRPWGRSRWVEWLVLAALLAALAIFFAREVRLMQGQGELSAVKATLGALRTTLVIHHVQQRVAAVPSTVALAQRNPFELLQRRPLNYRGKMNREQAALAPAGSWVFDSDCVCVGYRPIHSQSFESPSGDPAAWFEVVGAPGPLQIMAKERYVWQGEVVR